jgi:hypothetical protein
MLTLAPARRPLEGITIIPTAITAVQKDAHRGAAGESGG